MELPPSISQIAHTSKPTKEQLIPHEADTRTPSTSKKRHLFDPPPSFWDNLSQHVLSPSTLREFDRRTTPRIHLPASNAQVLDEISLPHFKRFCLHGGPSLAEIVGYPGPTATPIPKSHSEEPDEIMAYTGPWEQHLIDFGIYLNGSIPTQAPTNLSDIQARLKRRRPSLDNLNDDYPEFKKKNREANSKSSAMTLVLSTFLGNLDIPQEQGILFSNLTGLTDGSIPMPKPEFYDGSHPSTIECGLREDLAKFIIPSNNPSAAILPTFLMTVSSAIPLANQIRAAWYYGIFAARGIHRLRCRIPLQELNNKTAYVLTALYDPSTFYLSLYSTHVVITNNTAAPIEYHTVLCGSWCMEMDGEKFRAAISALRNAREWARDQREELIRLSKAQPT